MSSLYGFDQMHKLSNALDDDYFTPEQVNMLMEKGRLRQIRAWLESRAELNMIEAPSLKIDRTRPVRPEKLGCRYIEKENQISLAVEEIDPQLLSFTHLHYVGEEDAPLSTLMRRLNDGGHVPLDANVALALMQNQHLIPETWKGERNPLFFPKVFFAGTQFIGPYRDRYVLYLSWIEENWILEKAMMSVYLSGPEAMFAVLVKD